MSVTKVKQRPIHLPDGAKRDMRTQFGALCWRLNKDKVQVLLITSRRRGRWIVPKGWPVHGETPARAAAQEAWEEAGVVGKATALCLGIYTYDKETGDGPLPCLVALYPVAVKRLAADYPERRQRKRRWLGRKKAASLVDNPELAQMIRAFDPRRMPS